MKNSNTLLGICFAFFFLCGISMGNRIYALIALIIALTWIFCYLSVRLAQKSVKVDNALSGQKVNRTDMVSMDIGVSHKSILPIAPVVLHMRATSNTPAGIIRLTQLGKRKQRVTHHFSADHVGAMFPGVEKYIVSDIFGLFKNENIPESKGQELLVLPVPFEVTPLTFAPGDLGVETMKRALEDPSSPSDFRSYQQGDPLKRIHWKMSARKREIMIRQFEEPALPDALIIMDTSPAYVPEGFPLSLRPFLQDALLETVASVVKCQIREEHSVRVPIIDKENRVYLSEMGLPVLLEELAHITFNETEQFERVVNMQMAELRKTGAVVIVTTRLTSVLNDLLSKMKRLGPNVRVYFVTPTQDEPKSQSLVTRLQQRGIEVLYITPQQ